MDAEGLLAENVLLGLRGAEGPFPVLRMRRGDVDDVDLGVGEERLVRVVRVGRLVKLGEFERLRFPPGWPRRSALPFPSEGRPGQIYGRWSRFR